MQVSTSINMQCSASSSMLDPLLMLASSSKSSSTSINMQCYPHHHQCLHHHQNRQQRIILFFNITFYHLHYTHQDRAPETQRAYFLLQKKCDYFDHPHSNHQHDHHDIDNGLYNVNEKTGHAAQSLKRLKSWSWKMKSIMISILTQSPVRSSSSLKCS